MMILEQNPRIGGAVDLGQLEKLKELQEFQRCLLNKKPMELPRTQLGPLVLIGSSALF